MTSLTADAVCRAEQLQKLKLKLKLKPRKTNLRYHSASVELSDVDLLTTVA